MNEFYTVLIWLYLFSFLVSLFFFLLPVRLTGVLDDLVRSNSMSSMRFLCFFLPCPSHVSSVNIYMLHTCIGCKGIF